MAGYEASISFDRADGLWVASTKNSYRCDWVKLWEVEMHQAGKSKVQPSNSILHHGLRVNYEKMIKYHRSNYGTGIVAKIRRGHIYSELREAKAENFVTVI